MNQAWKCLYLGFGLSLALSACDGGKSVGDDDDDDAAADDDDDDSASDDDDDATSDDDEVGPTEDLGCVSLIDDLEGTDTPLIPARDGRQGSWYVYNDETEGAVQTPPACGEPFKGTSTSSPDLGLGLFVARSSGSGFTDWGAGFGFDMNNLGMTPEVVDGECIIDYSTRMAYDASAYTGIAFYAKSYGNPTYVDVKIPSMIETPDTEGGTCTGGDSNCGNSYQSSALLTSDWKGFRLDFANFNQPSWGPRYESDLAQLVGIQFQLRKGEDFDVAVDNICFY